MPSVEIKYYDALGETKVVFSDFDKYVGQYLFFDEAGKTQYLSPSPAYAQYLILEDSFNNEDLFEIKSGKFDVVFSLPDNIDRQVIKEDIDQSKFEFYVRDGISNHLIASDTVSKEGIAADATDYFSPFSVNFQKAGTLFPVNGVFNFSNTDYSYFECEFDSQTASALKKDIDGDGDSKLSSIQSAIVSINGKPYRRMYYEPTFLKIGENEFGNYGFLELHDLREHLKKGVINYAPSRANLEQTVEEIYKNRVKSGIFTGVEVNANAEDIALADETLRLDFPNPLNESGQKKVEFGYGIHFDGVSPLTALQEATTKFGVNSRVTPEGKLIIGRYENNDHYIGSFSGKNVDYHITESSVSKLKSKIARLKIKGPIVKGGYEYSEGVLNGDEYAEGILNWLDKKENEKSGYRVIIDVNNTNISESDGQVVELNIENIDQHSENLEALAKRQLIGIETAAGSGSITVNMSNSEADHPPTLKDTFTVKREENTVGINSSFNEEYYVTAVNNTYKDKWRAEIDLQNIPSKFSDLSANVKFYDISSDQTLTHKEIYGYERGR